MGRDKWRGNYMLSGRQFEPVGEEILWVGDTSM